MVHPTILADQCKWTSIPASLFKANRSMSSSLSRPMGGLLEAEQKCIAVEHERLWMNGGTANVCTNLCRCNIIILSSSAEAGHCYAGVAYFYSSTSPSRPIYHRLTAGKNLKNDALVTTSCFAHFDSYTRRRGARERGVCTPLADTDTTWSWGAWPTGARRRKR